MCINSMPGKIALAVRKVFKPSIRFGDSFDCPMLLPGDVVEILHLTILNGDCSIYVDPVQVRQAAGWLFNA